MGLERRRLGLLQWYALRPSRSFDRRLIRNTAAFGAGLQTAEDEADPGEVRAVLGRHQVVGSSFFKADLPDNLPRPDNFQ